MSRPIYLAALLVIFALALGLRLPNLAQRPMHNDEAVNAVKFNELWTTGKFEYDPNEYHGPTLYYLTLPFVWASGAKNFAETNETVYRLLPVFFGVGLILLLPLLSDGLGRGGVIWAALFTAVSPGMVFYSRYYIHEMPLIFFAFAAIACGWRYRRSKKMYWAALSGGFIGLAYATKETWVFALIAAGGAAITAATIWHVLLKGPGHRLHFRSRALLYGAVAFIVVFVTLFSGFFRQPSGPWKAISSYFHYSQRASGGIHDHPWHYYFSTVLYSHYKGGPVWTEAAIIFLALVGFALAVVRRVKPSHTPGHPDHVPFSAYPPFVRFMGFYTLFLAIGFSIIPYKTPWCMLGFLHGMILLGGFTCAQLIHALPNIAIKSIATLPLFAAAGHLAYQADRATNNFADRKHPNAFAVHTYNPYVYAHTGTGFKGLTKQLAEMIPFAPQGPRSQIAVLGDDYWPVPFYLRSYPNVGYWQDPVQAPRVPFIISPESARQTLLDKFGDSYVSETHGLRPGAKLILWIDKSIYESARKART